MLKIVNCSKRCKYVSLAAIMGFCVLVFSGYAYAETETEWQDASSNASTCDKSGEYYSPGNFKVCQSDTGEEYRYSRWVYYNVDTEYLPSKNGKKYIPPIGPGDSNTGSSDDGNLGGWLRVNDDISDCIVENGGFWRRGYFQKKDKIYEERNDGGKVFGVAQSGLAPIGFTGRTSDHIESEDEVGHYDSRHSIGEWRPTKPITPLGQQILYYGSIENVWARMDTTKEPINDNDAQKLFSSFGGGELDYGDYFMSDYDFSKGHDKDNDAGTATVLFCYSENEPYNGVVKIGSSSAIYAYDSKNYNESEKSKGIKGGTKSEDDPITIDLGAVSERSYTPGYIISQVSKNDSTKTGKTSYNTNLYLNGVKKYTGVNGKWSSTTSDSKTEIDSNTTYSGTPNFDLAIGENTICVDLSYKEKNNSSDYVSLKACAKITYDPSFTCNINGATISYSESVNYGRMIINKNGIRTTLGDSTGGTYTPSATMWLKPEDEISISYEGCIGEQIAKDKGFADWNAERTGNNQNSIMGVETTGNLLDSSHYTGTENSIDKESINGKNINAREVLGSTISEHINKKYQFGVQKTKPAQVGNVGQIINNDYKIRSDGTRDNVRATMKIPYNYVLEPKAKAVSATGGIITLGGSATFEVGVTKNGRINEPVNVSNEYSTVVKPGTKSMYLSFRLSTGTNLSEFTGKLKNIEYLDGDKVDNLSGVLRANFSTTDIESGEISADDINNNAGKTINLKAADASADYNKLCVAVAVWPADSHNIRTGDNTIRTENQPTALDPNHYYDDAFTRITASCVTVGKYPTTSIEGNGIVAGGNVTGAYTEYNNRYFGSWTEYSLISNSVQNFASGASIAYTNPQTTINATAAWNLGGLNKEYFDSPQTLGNMSDEVGLQDEAEASLRASQMQSFVDDVKSTFFAGTPGGSETIMQFKDSKTFINTNFDSDVIIGTELASDINDKANKGMVLIYSQGNIKISNEVQYLKAVLIADGKVDTCFEKDQGGDNGQLLDYCYNPLVINGVVFSNKDIALDRVYGGGSTDGMNLDSNTLIQRAEIFNFNPEIVEWGYNYKHKTQPITTTYIEELSTRY